jgi:DnaJ-class molecular chaperone
MQHKEEVDKCKNEPKTLSALVERGMQDGHELRFKYASEQSPGGRIPGDVVLILQQQKHSRLTNTSKSSTRGRGSACARRSA